MADFVTANPTQVSDPSTQTPSNVAPASPGTVVTPGSSSIQPGQFGSFFNKTSVSGGNGMDPNTFTSMLGQVQNNLEYNNNLVSQRQLLMKQLYDAPLTDQEMAQLPSDMQNVVAQGKDATELQIKVLNDQLQGRASTLSSSISALTTGYENSQANTQNAITSILNYAKSTGRPIKDVAQALAPIYGLSVTNKMLGNLKLLGSTLLTTTQIPNDTTPANSGTVVDGYDLGATSTIGAYATDPNQPADVRAINDQLSSNFGTITDPQTADSAIQSLTPGSPITGEMVMQAAETYGVDPGVLLSVMQNDSELGTQGVGATTNNPGNVGNTGSATQAYSSWQDGVNAVAQNLAQRVTTTGNQPVATAVPPDNSTPQAQTAANTPNTETGVSPNGIYQAALDYLFAGKTPPLGLGSSAAVKDIRTQIVNTAAAVSQVLGTSFPQAQMAYKADATATSQNVQRLARVASIEDTLTNQIPRLATLADEVQSKGITLTEQDVQAGSAAVQARLGSAAAAQYIELLTTIRSDYGAQQAALAGSRGGEFFSNSAVQAFPLGYSGAQYTALGQTIMTSAENIKAGITEELNTLAAPSNPGGNTQETPPANNNQSDPLGILS